MKLCPVNELVNQNFNLIFINSLQQFWHTTKRFQCIGEPKKQNLLLFIKDCKITYTDKNNRTFEATSGDIVYTPIGSEYIVHLTDFQNNNSHTVGINFLLFSEMGEPVVIFDDIHVFRGLQNQIFDTLFHQTLHNDVSKNALRSRILLMEILLQLSSKELQKSVPDAIACGIQYLHDNVEENASISALAKYCCVSEVYFRKQFKKYMGITPSEYRNALRLERACSYLKYGDISVQEISDTLGYFTVSHFIKQFKDAYGFSPLQYRKANRH